MSSDYLFKRVSVTLQVSSVFSLIMVTFVKIKVMFCLSVNECFQLLFPGYYGLPWVTVFALMDIKWYVVSTCMRVFLSYSPRIIGILMNFSHGIVSLLWTWFWRLKLFFMSLPLFLSSFLYGKVLVEIDYCLWFWSTKDLFPR